MYQQVVKTVPEQKLISIHDAIVQLCDPDFSGILFGVHGAEIYILKRDFDKCNTWRWHSLFGNNHYSVMTNSLGNYINEMTTVYLLHDKTDLKEFVLKL